MNREKPSDDSISKTRNNLTLPESIIREIRNRIRRWAHSTTPEIRRIEYEFWQVFRMQKMVADFQELNKEALLAGKFQYDESQFKSDWEEYGKTFLKGDEKNRALSELVSGVLSDLPIILEKIKTDLEECGLDREQTKISISIGGSLALGVRDKKLAPHTDIDIYITVGADNLLINGKTDWIKKNSTDRSYSLTYNNALKAPSYQIFHIFLQPHIEIYTEFTPEEKATLVRELRADIIQDLGDQMDYEGSDAKNWIAYNLWIEHSGLLEIRRGMSFEQLNTHYRDSF